MLAAPAVPVVTASPPPVECRHVVFADAYYADEGLRRGLCLRCKQFVPPLPVRR